MAIGTTAAILGAAALGAAGSIAGGVMQSNAATQAANTQAAAADTPAAPVPLHIRNAPTSLMKDLGYGKGYRYAFDDPAAYTAQEYLPDQLSGTVFYTPGPFGHERRIAERMAWWQGRGEGTGNEQS